MQTKLTLRLDENLIALAKKEAKKTGKSLSQMVADYFKLLQAQKDMKKVAGKKRQLGPITRSLAGVLKSAGRDPEKIKHKYWEKKYL